jgi:Fuc2NAc and GlcNAc transferase
MFNVFSLLIISAILSSFTLLLFLPTFTRYIQDRPNCRSAHVKVTPRGGGIVFVFWSFIGCLVLLKLQYLPSSLASIVFIQLGSLPLALIGFLDDIYNLPRLIRFIAQTLTAIFLLSLSPLLSLSLSYSFMILLIFLAIGVTNFINFMDGMDGLVAGSMLVSITALFIEFDCSITLSILIGSLLGFLFFNFPPARIFMGDVGSTFLGAIFAGLVLQGTTFQESLGYLMLGFPLLADSFFCFLRRLFARQKVFQAHRLHLFQRLHQAGWSHFQVSSLYIMSTLVLSLSLLWGGQLFVFVSAFLVLITGFWLDRHCAVPFNVGSLY